MAMRASNLVVYGGAKSINPWDLDSDIGWTIPSSGEKQSAVNEYFTRVPWLFRGVTDRAENVGSMPFEIRKGETEIDTSADWQNKILCIANPGRLLRQIEMSLAMTGAAYLFKESNSSGYVKRLVYCAPSTVTEVRDNVTQMLTGYRRNNQVYKLEQFVAILIADHMTEDGAPKSSAALAALTASGVLYNADRFISEYFRRGAIKATVLQMEGGSPLEAERLQNWWEKVVGGVKNAWAAFVLKAKAITPVVIGEGLEGLQNNELTTERRQDIATALGIPESRLWSSAANYATSEMDTQNYYKSTIIPECKTIADAFNEQLFTAEHKMAGYKWVFLTDTLEIFQRDAGEQAASAKAFIDFLVACPTAEVAFATAAMIGFEITPELKTAIEAMFAKREEDAARMEAQTAAPADNNPVQDDDEEPDEQPNPQEMRAILKTWERKALHAIKQGQPANVEFTTTVLPRRVRDAIRYELAGAQTVEDVKAIFDKVELPDPMAELKRANDLLERAMNVTA